ncbi:MAG: response regulator [Alphaproteobacteria bacterium]|nr:response regulator [Alphaproteobacteria bacterium]
MNRRRPHILLVEDYHANILVATAMLEGFGYDCSVAKDGREALDLVKNQSFDLVLMDVQMPDMDGFEATRVIRQWHKEQGTPHLPIIAMTAHALVGDRERCLEAGMDDYIAKPFEPDDFKSKLERYLGE